jgi:hypothetical protein
MEDFTSSQWKFSIRFPGKPNEKQQNSPLGVQMNTFMTESPDGAYLVSVADMPIPDNETPAQVQARLDGAREGAVRNVNATLESSSAITLQEKYPGRELTAKLPPQPNGTKDGILRARVFLAGKRLYQVLVVGKASFVNGANSDEFLNSFKILD